MADTGAENSVLLKDKGHMTNKMIWAQGPKGQSLIHGPYMDHPNNDELRNGLGNPLISGNPRMFLSLVGP